MAVVIVGGGIAGLSLALGLHRVGVPCRVLEAHPLEELGGGAFLALAPNGVNALASLGTPAVLADAGGLPLAGIEFHNAAGRRVARLDGRAEPARFGAHSHLVRRGRLQQQLLAAVQAAGVPVEGDAPVVGVDEQHDRVRLTLADGTSRSAGLVVGADGVRSRVRGLRWPDAPQPRYTGVLDTGGWTGIDLPDTAGQQMWFGHRAFFGLVVRDHTAFWFSNVAARQEPSREQLAAVDPAEWMQTLRAAHRDDPLPIPAVLDAATGTVGTWPLLDLPPVEHWCSARVCLVGDAAHATSPTTGQGASLAIEDAVALAGELHATGHEHPAPALQRFVAARKPRADGIVAEGRRMGARKAVTGLRAAVRDLALPLFLRMGAASAQRHHAYRLPPLPR